MRFEENKIVLCSCRRGSNCPTIHPKDDGFDITDDFGGKVSLTNEEFFELAEAVEVYRKRTEDV